MGSYQVSVLGFGDNVVDKYEHIKTMYPGGNAVNFAVFAKQLGAQRSAYMGIFGSDQEAEHVIASLQEEGVELAKCQQVVGPNGAARVTGFSWAPTRAASGATCSLCWTALPWSM